MDASAQLKAWIVVYLKNRDAMTRSITGIDQSGSMFTIKKAMGDQRFLIIPDLSDPKQILDAVTGQLGVVVLNTRKNVDFVIANWPEFAKCRQLCFYFTNPKTNDKWLLYPYTHNQITEKAALRRGLEAMFAEVPAYI